MQFKCVIAYERSPRDLRCDYRTQERAKSLTLTVAQPLEVDFTLFADLIVKIEGLIKLRQAIALNTAQTKILQALDKYCLTLEDLAYTIGQSQAVTRTIVEELWKKGYTDYLKSSILYILFPGMRNCRYRQTSVAPDVFLTLTAKGYFHLYPLFQRLDAEVLA